MLMKYAYVIPLRGDRRRARADARSASRHNDRVGVF
jgi:hypothetical protein